MITFVSGVCGSGKSAHAVGLSKIWASKYSSIYSNDESMGSKFSHLADLIDKKNCLFIIDEAQSFDLSSLFNNEFRANNDFIVISQHLKLMPALFHSLINEQITIARKINYER